MCNPYCLERKLLKAFEILFILSCYHTFFGILWNISNFRFKILKLFHLSANNCILLFKQFLNDFFFYLRQNLLEIFCILNYLFEIVVSLFYIYKTWKSFIFIYFIYCFILYFLKLISAIYAIYFFVSKRLLYALLFHFIYSKVLFFIKFSFHFSHNNQKVII